MGSLASLRESLDGVDSLILLESKFADPPPAGDRRTAFALRGACVVLTVAAFEAYLRSLFEEQLDRVLRQHVPLAHFPEKLRIEATYASLELAMKGDHVTRGRDKAQRLGQLSRVARLVAADSFWPRAMANTQSNPDAACVVRMFKAVGAQGILRSILPQFQLAWGGPVAVTYPETRLDALVSSRHQVAHTADAAHITRAELAENVRFTYALATVLHDYLREHINTMILEARASFLAESGLAE